MQDNLPVVPEWTSTHSTRVSLTFSRDLELIGFIDKSSGCFDIIDRLHGIIVVAAVYRLEALGPVGKIQLPIPPAQPDPAVRNLPSLEVGLRESGQNSRPLNNNNGFLGIKENLAFDMTLGLIVNTKTKDAPSFLDASNQNKSLYRSDQAST